MNDHTESLEIAGRLRDSINSLHSLAEDVGKARQVREFASERRKNLLARYVSPLVANGKSATMAEWLARAEPQYIEELSELEDQQLTAEKVIARYDAEKCRYEGARSLLSFSRIVMDNLQG